VRGGGVALQWRDGRGRRVDGVFGVQRRVVGSGHVGGWAGGGDVFR
jgi:hypothetical protein